MTGKTKEEANSSEEKSLKQEIMKQLTLEPHHCLCLDGTVTISISVKKDVKKCCEQESADVLTFWDTEYSNISQGFTEFSYR